MAGSGVTLGFLKFVLGFDSASFESGVDRANKKMAGMQKTIEAHASKMVDVGKKLSLGITTPLTAFAAAGIKEAQETAQAMGQVNAALASMGPAAGRTAEQLTGLADKLELGSLYEGDEILRNVTATLLQFGNVSGQVFDRAQQVIVDYATRSGKDLGAATIAIGKALNDPVKGMGALSKAGVKLSDDQTALVKKLMETGHAAEAQGIVLAALEQKFKGSAAAAQAADPMNKLSDAFKQMAERVGTVLLPLIPKLTDALVNLTQMFSGLSPETIKWVVIIGGIAAAVGPVLVALGALVSLFGTLLPAISAISAAIGSAGLIATLGPLAIAVGAVVLAFKHWDEIKAFVDKAKSWVTDYEASVRKNVEGLKQSVSSGGSVWANYAKQVGDNVNGMKSAFQQMYNVAVNALKGIANAAYQWLVGGLGNIWGKVKQKLQEAGDFFKNMYDRVVGHSYVPDMVDEIGVQMNRLQPLMVDRAGQATNQTINQFKGMRDELDSILAGMGSSSGMPGGSDISVVNEGPMSETWDQLPDLADQFKTEFADPVQQSTVDIINSFADMATGAIGSLRGMVDAFKHGDILGGLQHILDLVTNVVNLLGKVGVLKLPQSSPPIAGARAFGGPVSAGKSYMVGENGPEFFTPSRSGYIHPNGSQQPLRVQIIPSPYFDAVVDDRAANVAKPMAVQASVNGAVGGVNAVQYKSRRSIP